MARNLASRATQLREAVHEVGVAQSVLTWRSSKRLGWAFLVMQMHILLLPNWMVHCLPEPSRRFILDGCSTLHGITP